MQQGERKIAIVHDELTRRGGAESVLDELIRIYPSADIYTLYAGTPVIEVDNVRRDVQTSFLQHLPRWFRRHPRRLAMLLPLAAEQLDLSNYDLVLSSASGFAKSIIVRAHVPHICYCHTPTRYLWENISQSLATIPRGLRTLAKLSQHVLRVSDFAAAARIDLFLVNSQWTRERVSTYYRRPSRVVYPPVDTTFFTPATRPLRLSRRPFLCVGRLTTHKRFDQAIAVCEKLGIPLIIVGTGDQRHNLQRLAGPFTTLVGTVDRVRLREYYRSARALLQPGQEDFGIATVEAQACGLPVIAYGTGGVREIVRPNETGILYDAPTVEALANAVHRFMSMDLGTNSELAQAQALRFSTMIFRSSLRQAVQSFIAKQASTTV